MVDKNRIEYAVLEDECRRLNVQKYSNDKFLEEIKDDLKRLNDKIDDLMLVIEEQIKETPKLEDIEHLYQVV